MSDAPCIRVVNVHKRFGTLDVPKGVSFEVHRGSVVSMINRMRRDLGMVFQQSICGRI
jgi:ABC-type histidine transport system ATPase subunit